MKGVAYAMGLLASGVQDRKAKKEKRARRTGPDGRRQSRSAGARVKEGRAES